MQWFTKLQSEKIPTAIDRYVKEINRVTGVVEGHLAAEKAKGGDGPWLVGGKLTFADIAWYMWQALITVVLGPDSEYFRSHACDSVFFSTVGGLLTVMLSHQLRRIPERQGVA